MPARAVSRRAPGPVPDPVLRLAIRLQHRGGRYLLAGLGHSFEQKQGALRNPGIHPATGEGLEPPDLSAAPDEEPSTQTSYVATRANGMWFGPDVYEARPRTDSPGGRRMRLTIWLKRTEPWESGRG